MSGLQKLQLIGLAATFISCAAAILSYWLWCRLPTDKKVWAVFAWIMYCGVLSMIAGYLNG